MRIVFISDTCLPSPSAEAVFVVRMAEAFTENGHDVTLLVPDRNRDRESDLSAIAAYFGFSPTFAIQVVAWSDTAKAIRLWAWRTAFSARELAPDLVYARHLAAGWAALQAGLPCVLELHQGLTEHGGPLGVLFNRIDDKFRQLSGCWQMIMLRARRAVDTPDYRALTAHNGFVQNTTLLHRVADDPRLLRLVVITHALARHITDVEPQLASRLCVAPDGARLPARTRRPPVVLDADVFHVGYCGHLFAGKGIEVIADLARRCPWAQFHVVGGLEHDRAAWQAGTTNCPNLVFHGHVEPHQVPNWLAAFDVCLLPNQPDVATCQRTKRGDPSKNIGAYTSPMKMFEYMAAGKPIIASDLPVLREILQHEANALLCRHDDIGAWSKALTQLVHDRDLATRLGKTAYKDFVDRYTWTARTERVIANVVPTSPIA